MLRYGQMKSQISFILGLACLSVCSGHIGGGQLMIQELNPQVYCGRNLARALAELCNLSSEKRSESGTMYNSILTPYYKDQEQQYGWPWLSPHKARGLAPPRGKRFGGVVNECCDKACSIDEMLSYCN